MSGKPAGWSRKLWRRAGWGFAVLIAIGYYGYTLVESEIKQEIESRLQSTLRIERRNFLVWLEAKKQVARFWAGEPGLKQFLSTSQSRPAGHPSNRNPLFQFSTHPDALRKLLDPVTRQNGFSRFMVLDRRGHPILTSKDKPNGAAPWVPQNDWVGEIIESNTADLLLHPIRTNSEGRDSRRWILYIAAPIRNDSNRVIGVLGFQLDMTSSLREMPGLRLIGQNEEISLFDSDGWVVSQVRSQEIDQSPAAATPSPGKFKTPRLCAAERWFFRKARGDPHDWNTCELTKLARGAIEGRAGVDIVGYRSVSGDDVVGAWDWLEEIGLGLGYEISRANALQPLTQVRKIYFIVLAYLGISFFMALLFRIWKEQSDFKRLEANKRMRASEEQTRSILFNTLDGIVTFRKDLTIESSNPAAEKLFGYSTQEMAGNNLKNLIRTDNGKACLAILEHRIQQADSGPVSHGQEIIGQTRQGTTIDLELSVSAMRVGDDPLYIGIFRDITERKRNQRILDKLNKQYEQILHAVAEGIFGIDMEGRVTFLNPAAEQLLGYRAEQLIGQPAHHLLHAPDQIWNSILRDQCLLYEPLKHQIACRDPEARFWRKDGSTFPAEYTSTSTVDDGKIVGAVVVFRNISERYQAEWKLRHYASDLEKINEELKNFTYVASHDLQEPLRKVLTMIDRLRMTNEKNMDEKGVDYLGRIQEAVSKMRQLIYDLLDYSQSTSSQCTIEATNLNEEVEIVISSLELWLEQENAQVEVGKLPVLQASRFQIRQLFKNLISNALKYRKPDTPPHIRIDAKRCDVNTWRIIVEDNGIGFETKYLDRIFKPFQRLHPSNQYSGSGIGLAICEKIVDRHQGSITAESVPGEGTRFIITLPEKQVKLEEV